MDVAAIQEELKQQSLDGWLFFDHHERDPLAYRVLGFKPERHVTRRWYYLIPASGEPIGMVHRIEAGMLDPLPGEKIPYSSWSEQSDGLCKLLRGCRRVAMQYSPLCAIPYVSMVDAGTVELVRGCGIEVISSADLIQYFEARWSTEALQSHLEAGRHVDRVRREAFEMIAEKVRTVGTTEFAVKMFILDSFGREGLFTDHGPIVGVNANASNPHYEPTAEASLPIRAGDFVLVDMWARLLRPHAVYYDITWTGVFGGSPTGKMNEVFEVVRGARDRAVGLVKQAAATGRELRGFEVDDAARSHIRQCGYGDYFIHRTGHSIGEDVHGSGANMDNLETHDERRVLSRTCFSIEPGVYLPDFGVRSEVNVFVGDREALVTGEVQTELVVL